MRPERTKVSFDCTQNRFSKEKFQTDGWRGGGGGGNTFACISTSLNSFDFSWYIIAFSLSFVVLFICIF